MTHVYSVASGFGLRVIPRAAPYSFMLGPTERDLDVQREQDGKILFARVVPTADGYSSLIADGTPFLYDVVDIVSGPTWDSWWLETNVYRLPIPTGWRAHAQASPGDVAVIDLFGPNDALLYIQTPRSISDSLVGPGQQVVRNGQTQRSSWVELEYKYDASPWIQRHDVIDLGTNTCVVTTQSPRDAWPTTHDVAEHIAKYINAPS